MQEKITVDIPGVYLLKNFSATDNRGLFVKTFHKENFEAAGLATAFTESYYSVSHQNVIRGMHFQVPPHQHDKLVYVTEGKILDVILDIRTTSPTFGKYVTLSLEQGGNSVYIPQGCAHGFLTLTPQATVVYNVTTVYNAAADAGIHYNSFGFNWEVANPVVSQRDQNFNSFKNFKSPF